jgi:NTE family protein
MAQDLGVSQHAAAAHLPESRERRTGLALCLSGGGFRALLFHLGALRRLNELGILSSLDSITSVSGGSIIAARLATRLRLWPDPGALVGDWEHKVAGPFRGLVATNTRTRPVLRRLFPWNCWARTGTEVETLAERYREDLTDAEALTSRATASRQRGMA